MRFLKRYSLWPPLVRAGSAIAASPEGLWIQGQTSGLQVLQMDTLSGLQITTGNHHPADFLEDGPRSGPDSLASSKRTHHPQGPAES